MSRFRIFINKIGSSFSAAAFVLATAFWWGFAEAVVNRWWRFYGTWWTPALWDSVYARMLFYFYVVAGIYLFCFAAAKLARAVVLFRKKVFIGRGAWAAAAVVIFNAAWLLAGTDAKARWQVGPFIIDLRNPGHFFIYWAAVVALTVAAAVVVAKVGKGRLWRRLGRVSVASGTAAFVATFAFYHISRACRPVPRGASVVLIVWDAWRADAFRPDLTPNLWRYARGNAVVYTRVWSAAPWTLPSVAGFLTGQNPDRYRVGPRAWRDLPVSVPQILWREGYDTAAFTANIVLERYTPLMAGFDEFEFWDWRPGLKFVHFYDTHWYCPAVRKAFGLHPKCGPGAGRRLTELACRFLARRRARPFFLYVHYMEPHHPYSPPPGFYRQEDARYLTAPHLRGRAHRDAQKRLYEGEIAYLDTLIPALLKAAARQHDLVIIITADHGEEFWEHKTFGHGKSVYEVVTRVPLIFAAPGRPAGADETPTTLLDLAPTIYDLASVPKPPGLVGESLLVGRRADRVIFVGSEFTKHGDYQPPRADAAIKWPYKLILRHDDLDAGGEFYNLAEDPVERRPLPEDELAQALRAELKRWNAAGGTASALEGADAADLRALGYIR